MKKAIYVALAIGVLLIISGYAGLFYTWNLKLTDALYHAKPALNGISIITIDDKSIQEIGRWPWQRDVFVALLNHTSRARVVAFDVAFFEQTPQDRQLSTAMRQAGNVIIAKEYDYTRKKTLLLAPGFENITTGMVNVYTDQDGISRSIPLMIDNQPSFAYRIATAYLGKEPSPPYQRLLVNFVGKEGSYPYYSATDVINGRINDAEFKDAIVLIGATAPDLHDDYIVPTSAGKRMPGVEIHAHAVQTLLTRQFLRNQEFSSVAIIILLISILTGILSVTVRIWKGALILFIIAIIYFFVAIQFFNRGIILNLVYPGLTIITTSLASVSYVAASESQHKKEILGMFGRYVAPEVVHELMKNPDKLKLGGEKRQISIFFSDIRGFTTFSEQLTPEQLVHLLNDYLTHMTDIIMHHNGVVDKFIGDAIMAFWGAPLEQPDHATLAAKAAIEMNDKLKELQYKWENEGYPKVEIGIGINTGDAVIGNMGSNQRFNYTCMGDTINLGSRLEGITKEYGVKILISETTSKQLPEEFIVRELDIVKVKGKNEPIRIYELICTKDTLTIKQKHIITHFAAGLQKYRAKEFKKAIADFAKSAHEGDKTSDIYIKRCEHFIKEHPGKDWDCVWEMKTK